MCVYMCEHMYVHVLSTMSPCTVRITFIHCTSNYHRGVEGQGVCLLSHYVKEQLVLAISKALSQVIFVLQYNVMCL